MLCALLCACLLTGCGKTGEKKNTVTAAPTGQEAAGGQSGSGPANGQEAAGNPNDSAPADVQSGTGGQGDSQPTAAPTERPVSELEQFLAGYEVYEPGHYTFSVNEKEIVRSFNSNNLDFLCEAPDGSLYYVDPADEHLYHGGADGSERELISELNISGLQMSGDVLYFGAGSPRLVYRYLPEGEVEPLELAAGSFTVMPEGIYYCGTDGIYWYAFDTQSSEKLVDTGKYAPIWMTVSGTAIVYQLADESDPAFLKKGLVFCYTLEDKRTWFVMEKAFRATLEGNKLVYQNYDNGRLAWFDMENGEGGELASQSSTGILLGDTLYFIHLDGLYAWDMAEQTETKLWEMDAMPNYCYWTSDRVYAYTLDKRILFYEPETGSSGVWKE